jgi:hypothetical protein
LSKVSTVPRLRVKWVFAYPGRGTYAQPTVAGDRLFVPTVVGSVFSLDAASGCTHWSYDADAAVKTAVVIGPSKAAPSGTAAFFGDERGVVYAVDAETGHALWKQRVDDHPLARVIGAPTVFDGRLYVPLASQEEFGSRELSYACCTFRGSIVALDVESGRRSGKLRSTRRPSRTAWQQVFRQLALRSGIRGTGSTSARCTSVREIPVSPGSDTPPAIDLAAGARLGQPVQRATTGRQAAGSLGENCPTTDGPAKFRQCGDTDAVAGRPACHRP